ncbi:hypothetical protein D030_0393, partial [Vibrio parahaemolyticus AQ3810]
MFQFGVYR